MEGAKHGNQHHRRQSNTNKSIIAKIIAIIISRVLVILSLGAHGVIVPCYTLHVTNSDPETDGRRTAQFLRHLTLTLPSPLLPSQNSSLEMFCVRICGANERVGLISLAVLSQPATYQICFCACFPPHSQQFLSSSFAPSRVACSVGSDGASIE